MWEILRAEQNKERPNYCRLDISIQNYKILTNNKEICKLLKSTTERSKDQPRLPRQTPCHINLIVIHGRIQGPMKKERRTECNISWLLSHQ